MSVVALDDHRYRLGDSTIGAAVGDIADILAGAGSWFTADLLRLCAHADEGNLNRIRQGFPDVVETYLAWREGDNE